MSTLIMTKRDHVIWWLREQEDRLAETIGGYPRAISTEIPGWVVVAGPVDGGRTSIDCYPDAMLVIWYDLTRKHARANGEAEEYAALYNYSEEVERDAWATYRGEWLDKGV